MSLQTFRGDPLEEKTSHAWLPNGESLRDIIVEAPRNVSTGYCTKQVFNEPSHPGKFRVHVASRSAYLIAGRSAATGCRSGSDAAEISSLVTVS